MRPRAKACGFGVVVIAIAGCGGPAVPTATASTAAAPGPSSAPPRTTAEATPVRPEACAALAEAVARTHAQVELQFEPSGPPDVRAWMEANVAHRRTSWRARWEQHCLAAIAGKTAPDPPLACANDAIRPEQVRGCLRADDAWRPIVDDIEARGGDDTRAADVAPEIARVLVIGERSPCLEEVARKLAPGDDAVLVRAARDDTISLALRKRAVDLLGVRPGEVGWAFLREIASADDPTLQPTAAGALSRGFGAARTDEVVAILARLLAGPIRQVRIGAADALGRHGLRRDPKARAALTQRLAAETDSGVRAAIETALDTRRDEPGIGTTAPQPTSGCPDD